MTINKLKLNTDKTEFLIISSKTRRKPVPEISLDLGGIFVQPSIHARNLGVHIDSHFSLNVHVTNVIKSCYISLRNINSIRPYLTQAAAETVVHAFISSRLDFCNSLFIGLPAYTIKRLQKIQNAAAKLTTCCRSRFVHVTPILRELHWLPVASRIEFKVLVLTHRCIYGSAPNYLSNAIVIKKANVNTRSSTTLSLTIPRSRGVMYSKRSFRIAAPMLWNALPKDLKHINVFETFKNHLKTFLFNKYFC